MSQTDSNSTILSKHPTSFTASLSHALLLGINVPSASRTRPLKIFTWESM